jgi:hypothetical protein
MFMHGKGFVTLLEMEGNEMPKLEREVAVEDYLRTQALILLEIATTIVKG